MSKISAESQAERDAVIHDVVRTITLAGIIAISAITYDFISSVADGVDLVASLSFYVFGGVILTAVMGASWLGYMPRSRKTISIIFALVGFLMVATVAHRLFIEETPDAVERYMAWIVAILIIPFLTTNRRTARRLGGLFVAAIVSLIIAHVLRMGLDPFPQPCCANLILFASGLVVAYLLLDGLAMFKEAAIKLHARSDAFAESAAELKQAVEAADAARDEAEKSIRLRETFLATMSHELRTPLNAIIGFSEVMKSDALGRGGADQYQSYAADIHQSGEHVLGLINQLLEYSRIRSGTFDLKIGRLKLEELILLVQRMTRATAEAKGVKLSIDFDEMEETWVHADRQALIQIGLNLVGNALKFTEEGGTVTLKILEEDDGCVVLTVTDTGVGIPEDRLKDVRQPFVRLGDASLASETGTGLGLAIVTALADAMEAPLTLKSVLGVGTTVRLTLPKAIAPDEVIAIPQSAAG